MRRRNHLPDCKSPMRTRSKTSCTMIPHKPCSPSMSSYVPCYLPVNLLGQPWLARRKLCGNVGLNINMLTDKLMPWSRYLCKNFVSTHFYISSWYREHMTEARGSQRYFFHKWYGWRCWWRSSSQCHPYLAPVVSGLDGSIEGMNNYNTVKQTRLLSDYVSYGYKRVFTLRSYHWH